MDKQLLIQFRNKLLNGGVAYSHVKRSLRELQDHVFDLCRAGEKNGLSQAVAEREALAKIGSLDLLATAMLARPELKSLAYRYPKLTMVLGPVLTYLTIVVLTVLFIVAVVSTQSAFESEFDLELIPVWLKMAFASVRIMMMYILPPALSLSFLFYALKNRVPIKYFGWGLLLLCLLACAFSIQIYWPSPETGNVGQIGANFGFMINNGTETTLVYGNKLRFLTVVVLTVASAYFFQKKLENELESELI